MLRQSMMIRLVIGVALVFLLNLPTDSQAQVLRGRIHQVRSCPVTSCGLPGKYSYQSRYPKRESTAVGFATLTLSPDGVRANPSESLATNRHTFRFETPSVDVTTDNGTIRLETMGGTLTEDGIFQFSGFLRHDGGKDNILKHPKVTLRVDLMSSLSNEVTPPPNPVVVKSFERTLRAGFVSQTVSLGGLYQDSSLANRYPEVTHLRVQVIYHPEL